MSDVFVKLWINIDNFKPTGNIALIGFNIDFIDNLAQEPNSKILQEAVSDIMFICSNYFK